MTRNKTKTLTIYVDPKYEEKLLYLKQTSSITSFVEKALDELEIDKETLRLIKKIQKKKEG